MYFSELNPETQSAVRVLWDYHRIPESFSSADVAIVLGSHDLRVAQRAVEIFQRGLVPLLVMSGGSGKVTNGVWSEPEADVYANVARASGVPDSAMILERESGNTTDNIVNSRKILSKLGAATETAIVVSKPYMARRARAVAMKQWPDVKWGFCYPKVSLEDYATEETPLNRMVSLMVGDLQRIDLYAKKGFQAEEHIPRRVWDAYHFLVSSGFDAFVIRE